MQSGLQAMIVGLMMLAVTAVSASEPAPIGAGTKEHGWLILPTLSGGARVLHLGPDSEACSARTVTILPTYPLDATASDDELILVFEQPASRSAMPEGSVMRPIRSIKAREIGDSAIYAFSRPVAKTPLQIEGVLVDLCGTRQGLYALLGGPEDGGHDLWRLYVAGDDNWQPVELAEQVQSADSLSLIALDESLVVVARTGTVRSLHRLMETSEAETAWESTDLDMSSRESLLIGVDQVVAEVEWLEPEAPEVSVIWGGAVAERAQLQGVPRRSGVAAVGDRLFFAWKVASEDDGREVLQCASITLSGELLGQGPMLLDGPVSTSQLWLMLLMLFSLFLTILVFVFTPERARRPESIVLPEGTSLAEPGRRLTAMLIDLLPGVTLAWILWRPDSGIGPSLEAFGTLAEIVPLLLIGVVTFAHCSISEAAFGRTIGKRIVGARTIRIDGTRMSAGQAVLRTAVKILCPPLAVFILVSPWTPHPGSFRTIVIVNRRRSEPES